MFQKLIPQSSFSKNVLTLITGASIAQAIPILISPILSRLYSPNDFGQFAILMAIATIIGSVATLRYELAIVLPDNNKDAVNILAISLLSSLLIASISMLLIFQFKTQITTWSKFTSNSNLLYFIPLWILAIGCYQAFNYWSTREKMYRNNAVSRVLQTSSNSLLNVSVGYWKSSPFGLILGQVMGQTVAAITLAIKAFRNPNTDFKLVSFDSLKNNFLKHKRHASINSSHVLIDSILNHGITFLLVLFYTNAIVGFYAFAFRILKAPLSLIGSAMSQVFFQEANELNNQKKSIRSLVLNIYKKQFLIGFIPFTVLFIFTPQIFEWIFGSQWTQAGKIAQIILPWLFLNFLVSPVSTITIVVDKQKEALLLTIVDGTLKFASIIIGHYFDSYIISFTLMSVSSSSIMVFDIFWHLHLSSNNKSKMSDENIIS